MATRSLPNIIVTGTPGTGKTTHCETLAQRTGLRHISVTHIVKDKECHEGWDEEYQSWIVDEDKVMFPYYSVLFILLPFSSISSFIFTALLSRCCVYVPEKETKKANRSYPPVTINRQNPSFQVQPKKKEKKNLHAIHYNLHTYTRRR